MSCAHRWALEDPNAEDQAMGNTHHCTRPPQHSGPHRCACGATPDPPNSFLAALAAAINPEDTTP